jgi:hypothetical protein
MQRIAERPGHCLFCELDQTSLKLHNAPQETRQANRLRSPKRPGQVPGITALIVINCINVLHLSHGMGIVYLPMDNNKKEQLNPDVRFDMFFT